MVLDPLGESAFIVRDLGDWDAFALSYAIEAGAVPGVSEAVCAYDTVAVYVKPGLSAEELLRGIESLSQADVPPSRHHTMPVCYELGEDLPRVAKHLGLSPEEVVRLHCSVEYRCYAIGFSPGFPYLGKLPDRLQGVPRLPDPRLKVPAGAVAVTGAQTGVYPQETPGGWSLIGRTPLQLVDLREGYFAIAAGDYVKFEPMERAAFELMEGTRL